MRVECLNHSNHPVVFFMIKLSIIFNIWDLCTSLDIKKAACSCEWSVFNIHDCRAACVGKSRMTVGNEASTLGEWWPCRPPHHNIFWQVGFFIPSSKHPVYRPAWWFLVNAATQRVNIGQSMQAVPRVISCVELLQLKQKLTKMRKIPHILQSTRLEKHVVPMN